MVICPDFVIYLVQTPCAHGWKLALRVSNILRANLAEGGTSVVAPAEAEALYKSLHGPPSTIASALGDLGNQKLDLWASTGFNRLSAILAEILKICSGGIQELSIILAIPYEPMPGCKSVDVLQELWTHPVLAKKYSNLVKSVRYPEQPMRCVFTGPVGPLHHLKSIALVHLGSRGACLPHSLVS